MAELILVGDIGGTNGRFALAERGKAVVRSERHHENTLFASLQEAIESYIADIGERPTAGVVAIAGPVVGDVVGPTNLPRWRFNPKALAKALNFSRLDVINDFEAVARALPHLAENETQAIGNVSGGAPGGNMAVLGPGTGLGVGALVRVGERWAAVPSEGGHAEISAPGADWVATHEALRKRIGRVEGETVLSGPGLEHVDTVLRAAAGGGPALSAAEIGGRALAGTDPIASEAVKIFFDYLAHFSGDVALMFAAKGGMFLYGGVVQKLSELLDPARFRATFAAKPPLGPFLEKIPVHLITAPSPGLVGCAAVAADW